MSTGGAGFVGGGQQKAPFWHENVFRFAFYFMFRYKVEFGRVH